jgi:hypothetical protein
MYHPARKGRRQALVALQATCDAVNATHPVTPWGVTVEGQSAWAGPSGERPSTIGWHRAADGRLIGAHGSTRQALHLTFQYAAERLILDPHRCEWTVRGTSPLAAGRLHHRAGLRAERLTGRVAFRPLHADGTSRDLHISDTGRILLEQQTIAESSNDPTTIATLIARWRTLRSPVDRQRVAHFWVGHHVPSLANAGLLALHELHASPRATRLMHAFSDSGPVPSLKHDLTLVEPHLITA